MGPPRFAVLALLCGILILNGWIAAGLAGLYSRGMEGGGSRVAFDSPRGTATAGDGVSGIELAAARITDAVLPADEMPPPPARIATASMPETVQDNVEASAPSVEVVAGMERCRVALPEPHTTMVPTAPIAPESGPEPLQNNVKATTPPLERAAAKSVSAIVPVSHEIPPPVTAPVLLTSLPRSDPVEEAPRPVERAVETPTECLVAEICIDDYLWSLYERTPKVDMNKVVERIRMTVRKRGKLRTVIKSVAKYVVGDFTWKDPKAARRAAIPVKDYVIGGMERSFKFKLYYALRAMDDAGLMPGITSAFRDDYRQSIASGRKAASDSSYHGGSRRGGYGHGLAADIVSVKGETRQERFASSIVLWNWIDARETELGIGRPYLQRDPPHVGPIDGAEYIAKRGGAKVKLSGPAASRHAPVSVAGSTGVARPAIKARSIGAAATSR